MIIWISAAVIVLAVAAAAVVLVRTLRVVRRAGEESREIIGRLTAHIEPLREEGRLISASFAKLSEAAAQRDEALAAMEELKTARGNVSHLAGVVRAVVLVKKAVSGGIPTALGVALFDVFNPQRRS